MKLALIGENVSLSKSKWIHERLISCHYDLLSVSELEAAVSRLRTEYDGFNVTIPFKEKILPYLDELQGEAQRVQSCNTVAVLKGKLIGFNTDIYGFEKSLDGFVNLSNKKALVLGSGGAAKAVLFALAKQGADITVCNRTQKHAQETVKNLQIPAQICEKEVCFSRKYDIIINTTSVGMRDEECPFDVLEQNAPAYAADIICKDTAFLKRCKALGSKTMNGFRMLVYQAVKADEIFTGQAVDAEEIRAVIEEIV